MMKKKKCWKRRGKEFNRKSHAWHNIIGWSCTIADPRIPGTLLPPNSRKVKKKLIKNLKSPLKLQKNPSQFPALFSFFYFSLYSLNSLKSQMAKKSKERENEELISPLVPTKRRKNANRDTTNSDVCFVGKPLSDTEASDRWPHRYQSKVASPFSLSLLPHWFQNLRFCFS